MIPLLRNLLKNVAGLKASMLTVAAATAGEPTIATLLLGFATVLVITQSWAESHGEEGRGAVQDELDKLIRKYGTLEAALAKLADGMETHDAIEATRASEVLALLRTPEQQLEQLERKDDPAIMRALRFLEEQQARYGKQFEEALRSLGEGINTSLTRIGDGIASLGEGQDRNYRAVQKVDTRLAKLEHLFSSAAVDEEIDGAAQLIRQRKYKDALVLLERVREVRWSTLDGTARYRVLANMGIAHEGMDDYASAADLFLEAEPHRPGHEQARCLGAIAWGLKGDEQKAYGLASAITDDFPQSALAWSLRIRYAPVELSSDEIAEGVPKSVRGDAEVENALSHRALNAGRLEEAERHLRRALDDSPANPEITAQLGTIILSSVTAPLRHSRAQRPAPSKTGRIAEAVRFLDQAIAQLENHAAPERLAGLLLNRAIGQTLLGDSESAERDIERSHSVAPGLPEATIRFAFLLAERGNAEGAIRALRDAHDKVPTFEVDVLLAWFLNRRGQGKDQTEAIELLEGRREHLANVPEDSQAEFVSILFEAYLDSTRYEDAEELVNGAVPRAISEEMATILRARFSERRGDESTRRNLLRRAFEKRTNLSLPEQSVYLARELQRARLYSEALTAWGDIVSPEAFGAHTRDLLRCAKETGNDRTILDVCRALRKNGFQERDCIEAEAVTLAKYGEYDAAIRVLREGIAKGTVVSDQQILRLRLSVFGLQLNRPELVEQDAAKLPRPQTIDPRHAPAVVQVLRNGPDPTEATKFAYDVIRRHFRDPDAHVAMMAAVALHLGPEAELPAGDTVEPGLAAYFRELKHEERQAEFFIIEDDEDPDISRKELAPDHPTACELIGKQVGDEFVLNPDGMQKRRAVIVEIVHKCVARMRDSMSSWELRFPERFFVKEVRLDKTPAGNLDFAPILKSIDERVRAVEDVERLYRDNLLPLHVFSHTLGHTVFDAVLHVARSKHLRLRCSCGTTEETARAWAHLDKATAIVADITALASLHATQAVHLIRAVPHVVVGQGSLDVLRQMRDELVNRPGRGFVGKVGDQYVFTDYDDEHVRRQNQTYAAQFDTLLETVETVCEIQSGLPLASWDPKRRHELLELFGNATAESMAIATAREAPLWADDVTVGLVGEQDHGTCRVWTYILANWLADRRLVERSQLVDLTLKLLEAGYSFTPISAEVLAEAARRSRWDPDEDPLKDVVDEIARPEIQSMGLFGVLGRSIVLLWRVQGIEGQASRVLLRILDRVASRPGGCALLNALEQKLDDFFGLNVVDCAAAKTTIRAWSDGANRIVLP